MKNTREISYVAIGVIGVSFSPIITKFATAPALTIALYRLIFACIILLVINANKLSTLIDIPIKERVFSIISGVILAFHFYFWIASLKLTSVASATVLVNVHPIAILIIAKVFFNKKPKGYQIIAVSITLIGSYILAKSDLNLSSDVITGDMFAVISALLFAVYLTFGTLSRKSLTNFQYTMHVYGMCALTLIVLALVTGGSAFIVQNTVDWFVFLGLAIIPTLFGHSLFNKALEKLDASVISLAVLGEPILASLWAYLLFSELIGINQFIGAAIILVGIALYYIPEMRLLKNETRNQSS